MDDIKDIWIKTINEFGPEKVIEALKQKPLFFDKWRKEEDTLSDAFEREGFTIFSGYRIRISFYDKKYRAYTCGYEDDFSKYAYYFDFHFERKKFDSFDEAKLEVDQFLIKVGFRDFDGYLALIDFDKFEEYKKNRLNNL